MSEGFSSPKEKFATSYVVFPPEEEVVSEKPKTTAGRRVLVGIVVTVLCAYGAYDAYSRVRGSYPPGWGARASIGGAASAPLTSAAPPAPAKAANPSVEPPPAEHVASQSEEATAETAKESLSPAVRESDKEDLFGPDALAIMDEALEQGITAAPSAPEQSKLQVTPPRPPVENHPTPVAPTPIVAVSVPRKESEQKTEQHPASANPYEGVKLSQAPAEYVIPNGLASVDYSQREKYAGITFSEWRSWYNKLGAKRQAELKKVPAPIRELFERQMTAYNAKVLCMVCLDNPAHESCRGVTRAQLQNSCDFAKNYLGKNAQPLGVLFEPIYGVSVLRIPGSSLQVMTTVQGDGKVKPAAQTTRSSPAKRQPRFKSKPHQGKQSEDCLCDGSC